MDDQGQGGGPREQVDDAIAARDQATKRVAIGMGQDLRVFLPEFLRPRFAEGGLAKVERIGRGEIMVKVWPGAKGKPARPHKSSAREGVGGFWITFNYSKVGGDHAVVDTFRVTEAMSVEDDGRQLKITLPAGREPPLRIPAPAPAPRPVQVIPPAGVSLGDAVMAINARKRELGDAMSITLTREGVIKVTIMEEYE